MPIELDIIAFFLFAESEIGFIFPVMPMELGYVVIFSYYTSGIGFIFPIMPMELGIIAFFYCTNELDEFNKIS